jgi:hypothetical protein
MKVRQRLFAVTAAAIFAGAPLLAADAGAIARAQAELVRLRELAKIGAISQTRLSQAEDALADAQDDEVLGRLLYGNVGVENLTEAQSSELVNAAQRRVDRIAKRYVGQRTLVEQGVLPKSHLDDYERQISDRRLALQLAESRAKIFEDLLNMAKAEEVFTEEDPDLGPRPVVESYTGSGVFKETHLKYIASEFEKQFLKPLPISARGQTHLHTALGFDHSGRVDVGVNPDEPEGEWLRKTLENLRVPYIALRAMIPGKSTAPHIHIGLPSLRLKIQDPAGASGGGSGLH